jgi:hypothetical protein
MTPRVVRLPQQEWATGNDCKDQLKMAAVARGNVGLLRSAPNFIVTEQQGRMRVAKPRFP